VTIMTGDDPVPPDGIDLEKPNVARVYDYLLGGTANWSIDREFGDRVLETFPLIRDVALANRMFLNRVVRHLCALGIRQFVDIGAGVPTVGNTHEVADELAGAEGRRPDTRVVYIDNEPVAVAHAEVLLNQKGDSNRHAAVHADLRDPDAAWEQALDTELIDVHAPVALLLVAVLHGRQPGPDGTDVGARSVARLRELLPPGSVVAISHFTGDGAPADQAERADQVQKMYETTSSGPFRRTRAEIEALLDGWPMLDPGWVWVPEWHPEQTGPSVRTISFPAPSHSLLWSGVARKP
jgi:O-methyltransferase involved in polyketide biosynthesis